MCDQYIHDHYIHRYMQGFIRPNSENTNISTLILFYKLTAAVSFWAFCCINEKKNTCVSNI